MKKNQFLTISILEEVIPDSDISIDDGSKKFISTSFNIAKELNITSMSEVRKFFFIFHRKYLICKNS